MSVLKTDKYFPNKKTVFILLLLFFFQFNGKAQAQNKIDSLKDVIANTLTKGEFDSCDLANNYLKIIELSNNNNTFDDAMALIASAKKMNLKNCESFTELLIYEGSFLLRQNLIDSSIKQLNKALPYAFNRHLVGKIYFVLGSAQLTARHSELAVSSLSKATKIFKSVKDTARLISSLNNLANSFAQFGYFDSSIYYFKQSLLINKGKFLANGPKSASLCELGRVHMQLGNLESAEYYYDLVLKHGDENFSFPGYVVVYLNIGTLKFQKGEYDLAEFYINKSFERLKQIPSMDTRPKIYYLLAALAARNNNVELVNKYMGRADTLYLMELQKDRDIAISEAETKFNLAEKELKNELLAKENEVATKNLSFQRTIISLVLGALIFSVLLIWFIWNQRKKVKILYQKLDKHNIELKGLIDDKDNYMSLLAHDLRSPIASIVGLSDILLENATNEVKEHTDDIRKSAIGSLQIMNEVLDIYRFETGQEDFELELVEIGQICRHIVRRYEPLASAKLQKLTILCEEEIAVQSNPTLLKSVLGNLISNAIKYNNPNGTCSIKCSVHEKSVRLIVEDDGPGFSKSDRDKAFKKFQKLSAQPTGNESSSGLGLYMVKLMIEKIGGKIELANTEKNGATFIIELPN